MALLKFINFRIAKFCDKKWVYALAEDNYDYE